MEEKVKKPVNPQTAQTRTMLNTMIITAAEQQTMNFYMNAGT